MTGVRLAGGEVIACASVLASVAPGQLYGRLLEVNLPEDQAAVRQFRHGRGNFQLHYALDRHPEWLTSGLDDVALIHLVDGVDSVSKSANEAERGMLPATPTICVGQPHRLDPSRCPEGKAILWLQIPDAPRVIKGDAAGEITARDWDAAREDFADRTEEILSRHIKDFDKIKLARKAYSPADLERMNCNLVGGDPYGGACSVDQFFIWRPFAHSTNGTGLVRGLDPYRCLDASGAGAWRRDRALTRQRGWAHERRNPRRAAFGRDWLNQFRALSDESHHGALQRQLAR